MADRRGTARFTIALDIELTDEGATLTELTLIQALLARIEDLGPLINEPDSWARITGIDVKHGRLYLNHSSGAIEPETPEPPVVADNAGSLWARDHMDELRRRPNGKVIYRVIGGNGHFGGVKVRRSNDGRYSDYSFADLEKMIIIDPASIAEPARINLDLARP